jgi:hypothetical protein
LLDALLQICKRFLNPAEPPEEPGSRVKGRTEFRIELYRSTEMIQSLLRLSLPNDLREGKVAHRIARVALDVVCQLPPAFLCALRDLPAHSGTISPGILVIDAKPKIFVVSDYGVSIVTSVLSCMSQGEQYFGAIRSGPASLRQRVDSAAIVLHDPVEPRREPADNQGWLAAALPPLPARVVLDRNAWRAWRHVRDSGEYRNHLVFCARASVKAVYGTIIEA